MPIKVGGGNQPTNTVVSSKVSLKQSDSSLDQSDSFDLKLVASEISETIKDFPTRGCEERFLGVVSHHFPAEKVIGQGGIVGIHPAELTQRQQFENFFLAICVALQPKL